ncbi:MAG: tail fiber domain-containing protein [Minisyncoccia bacterium]
MKGNYYYHNLSTSIKFLTFSLVLGLVVSVSVFSLIPMFVSAIYSPGATLDPNCLPSDSDCTVSTHFTTAITALNLTGTSTGMNTGDVTLTNTVNGLTLSDQILTLGLSGASATGTLSAADWNTFNNKQPAGSYLISESDPLFMSASSTYLSTTTAAATYYLASNPDGYISSFAELDPVYTASSWSTTTNNSANWNTAFGWGNHANAGYLTSAIASSTYLSIATASSTYQPLGSYLTVETDPVFMSASSTYLSTTTAASTYLTLTSIAARLPAVDPAESNDGNVFAVHKETVGVGTGNDGNLTVTSADTVVNTYAETVNDLPLGQNYVLLRAGEGATLSAGLKADKQVMILQSQAYRNSGTIGNYEYITVDHITGDTVYFTVGVSRDYYSDSDGNKMNNTKTQIITVPNYDAVTINGGASLTATGWNGYKGGILVFKAKTSVGGSGSINVDGKGYRGTSVPYSTSEGYRGLDTGTTYSLDGGHTSGTSSLLSNLTMGDGGGSGGGAGGTSGNGGGIIAIFTANLSSYSSTLSSITGSYNPGYGGFHPGGGGAILIFGTTYTGSYTVAGGPGYYLNTSVGATLLSVVYKSLSITDISGAAALSGATFTGTISGTVLNMSSTTSVSNFLGKLSVGTSSSLATLTVSGNGYFSDILTVASTTGTSTFAGRLTALNLIGTNTGDVTLSNNINGLTISGQALTLGLAGASATGSLSSADWNMFNDKPTLPTAALTDDGKVLAASVTSNSNTGTGADGDLTVSSDTVVNTYAGITNDVAQNATSLIVADSSGFTAGNEIMIIQMQTYRGGTLGAYEFATIDSVVGNTINLQAGVSRAYYSDTLTVNGQYTRAQIVKIPQYHDVTINTGFNIISTPWDGTKGGIVSFKVSGTLSGSGGINVDGAGYRVDPCGGTQYGCSPYGEGYFGPRVSSLIYGGGLNSSAGGHATAGTGATPGAAFGSSDLTTSLTFGAAGGHQRTEYSMAGYPDVGGVRGGGIIAIYVNSITLLGTLSAKGNDGGASGYWTLSYGASAGGSILLAETLYPSASYTVAGGTGNNTGGVGYYQNTDVAVPPTVGYYYKTLNPTNVGLAPLSVTSTSSLSVNGNTYVSDVLSVASTTGLSNFLGKLSIGTSTSLATLTVSGNGYFSDVLNVASTTGTSTLSGYLTALNLSGTNTGDVTLSNNINGLTISGQALNLGLAGTSATGTLSSADWNTFNNKLSTTTASTTYAALAGADFTGPISSQDVLSLNNNLCLNGECITGWGDVAGAPAASNNVSVTNTVLASGAWEDASVSDNGQYQLAVQLNNVYLSSNYGVDWAIATTSAGANFVGVEMSDNGQYQTAVCESTGANDNIFTSSDYGATWTIRNIDSSWQDISISSSGQYQTAARYGTDLYTSSDYGVTWTQRDAVNASWKAVAINGAGDIQFAADYGGRLWKSTNYGANWTQLTDTPINVNKNWNGIAVSEDGNYVSAAAYGSRIYVSSDSGTTWTEKDTVNRYWRDISMTADGATQIAVDGYTGNRYHFISNDYGETWSIVGGSQYWMTVDMSDDGSYYISTVNSGQVYVTNTGGSNSVVAGSGATGQVGFWNASTTQSGDDNLFWNNGSKSLSIGTTTALAKLTVIGNTYISDILTVGSTTGTSTFAGYLTALNLSGTNTGDVTLTNNINGLTISGQALTLGLAGASATGTLSATDWNTFNNKLTNPMTAIGELIYGGTSGVGTKLTVGLAGQMLRSGGAGADLAWSTTTYPGTTVANQILLSTATNTVAGDPGLTYDVNAGVLSVGTSTEVFTVLNNGNVGIGTTTPEHLLILAGGAYSDGSTWTDASSRDLKENFTALDKIEILNKIADLDITKWNYKTEATSTTHIGPVAEDFYEKFTVGQNNRSIAALDTAGIALIGIQALNENINLIFGTTSIATFAESTTMDSLSVTDFFTSMVKSALNKLSSIFIDTVLSVRGVKTNELCVGDTCITESELRTLLENNNVHSSSNNFVDDSSNNENSTSTESTATSTEETATTTATTTEQTTGDNATTTDQTATSTEPIVPTCSDNQTLVDNVCVDNAPVVPTCTENQTLTDNVCVDNPPTVPTCSDTQTLVDNICIDNPPVEPPPVI